MDRFCLCPELSTECLYLAPVSPKIVIGKSTVESRCKTCHSHTGQGSLVGAKPPKRTGGTTVKTFWFRDQSIPPQLPPSDGENGRCIPPILFLA